MKTHYKVLIAISLIALCSAAGCTNILPTPYSPAKTQTSLDPSLPTMATNLPQQSGTIIYIPKGTQGQIGNVRIGLASTRPANYSDSKGMKQYGMTADVQLFSRGGSNESLSVYLGQTFEFDEYTIFVKEIRPTSNNPGDPPGASGGGGISLLCIQKDSVNATTYPTTPVPSKMPLTPVVYGTVMPLEAQLVTIGLAIGENVYVQLPAAGGMPPYSWKLWSAGNVPSGYQAGLPSGLSLDPNGYLTGTLIEAKAASYHYALVLQDAGGTSVVTEYNLVIRGPSTPGLQGEGGPGFGGIQAATTHGFEFNAAKAYDRSGLSGYLNKGLADLTSDQFIYMVPFVHGGTRPWTFLITGLPEGLTYDPSTGIVQGMLDKAKFRTTIEAKSYLKDKAGEAAYPESGSTYRFRVDYVDPVAVRNPLATEKGTLSASGGTGNTLSLSGIGFIGTGSAVVTIPAGSYTLTVTSPDKRVLYQGIVRIDAGKVTTARISLG